VGGGLVGHVGSFGKSVVLIVVEEYPGAEMMHNESIILFYMYTHM
jgi:hypothetical protein